MYKRIRNLYIVTLVVGAIAYFLGLLTAPKSGKELRREIESTGHKNLIALEKQLKAQFSDLSLQLHELESKLDDSSIIVTKDINKSIAQINNLLNRSKLLLSALHDGSVDDDELIKVINEIKSLKSSVKKYFKAQ